jgi:hypothetical protein
MPPDAGFLRDILERAVSSIPVQRVRESVVVPRVTIDADAASAVATKPNVAGRPLEIVDDEKIELAVAIEIEPPGSDGP